MEGLEGLVQVVDEAVAVFLRKYAVVEHWAGWIQLLLSAFVDLLRLLWTTLLHHYVDKQVVFDFLVDVNLLVEIYDLLFDFSRALLLHLLGRIVHIQEVNDRFWALFGPLTLEDAVEEHLYALG